MAAFVRHLRGNGFPVGPAETADALRLLAAAGPENPGEVRAGLRCLLAGRREEWERFDTLFEAFWFRRGRVRQRPAPARPRAPRPMPGLRQDGGPGSAATRPGPVPGGGSAEAGGRARLDASRFENPARTDLRHLTRADEIAAAEALAYRLARALRYRLSRRFRAARAGRRLDPGRTLRASLGRGGEPIELRFRDRRDRPVNLVVLIDISGSMADYSRFYLHFLRGLVSAWPRVDGFLFHVTLLRVTAALKEKDPLRAMARLGLMAQGFGGGTRIAHCLKLFNDHYAKAALDSRTVMILVSDGFDADNRPGALARELGRLKRRLRRLIWLNPLLGWQGYEPTARAMAEALPFIDCFHAANTLESLAAIEPALARL